jgi:hypothetical protein
MQDLVTVVARRAIGSEPTDNRLDRPTARTRRLYSVGQRVFRRQHVYKEARLRACLPVLIAQGGGGGGRGGRGGGGRGGRGTTISTPLQVSSSCASRSRHGLGARHPPSVFQCRKPWQGVSAIDVIVDREPPDERNHGTPVVHPTTN